MQYYNTTLFGQLNNPEILPEKDTADFIGVSKRDKIASKQRNFTMNIGSRNSTKINTEPNMKNKLNNILKKFKKIKSNLKTVGVSKDIEIFEIEEIETEVDLEKLHFYDNAKYENINSVNLVE